MNTYETIFITIPTLTEDEERAVVGSLAEIVSGGGGTMVANERMGKRRLAFPIRKCDDGVYIRFLYDSDAAVPKELERRIRISDRILRYLTVRLEPDWAVAAKEQAVRDAQARAEAEAAREASEAAAAEEAQRETDEDSEDEASEDSDDEDDRDGPAWAETAGGGGERE